MGYVEFDEDKKFDIIFLGRVAIDFNSAYGEMVKEEFKPLKRVHYFEKFVGGSPANTACGLIGVSFSPPDVPTRPLLAAAIISMHGRCDNGP